MTNLAAHLERIPVLCFWEITDACNLRCIHCEANAGVRDPGELSTDQALALVRALADAGCRGVNLTGGEPLVRSDWRAIARELAAADIHVTIISNGLLIDEPCVADLVEAGVRSVGVSLDGLKPIHDAIRRAPSRSLRSRYDAAIDAIRLLVASPLKTAVITQVHQHNLDDLATIYELLVAAHVDQWQVQVAMPLGRLLEFQDEYLIRPADIQRLERQLAGYCDDGRLSIRVADNIGYYGRLEPRVRRTPAGQPGFWTGCLAGIRVVGICSDGGVKGCPSQPRPFVVGNVKDTPFSQIWDDDSNFAYNTAWREDQLVGGCAKCEYRRVCRAGCTTMAFAVTGTIHDNPFCLQRVQADRSSS